MRNERPKSGASNSDLMDWEQLREVFAYHTANTEKLMDWEGLHVNAPQPLTEREFCELIVDSANGRKLSGRERNQMVGLQVVSSRDAEPVALPEKRRKALIAKLAILVEGSEKDKLRLEHEAAKEANENVAIIPTWSPGGVRHDRIVARRFWGAVIYGLFLLSDRSGPFAKTLCRCQYSKCQKFFFKRAARGGRGAPNRRYCTPKHARLGDGEKARKRMADMRRKRK